MQVNSNSPSFCGYKSEFSRKLEQYISSGIKNEIKEQELTDSFSKVMVENMIESNEKGKGVHGVVYGIDDDYVFKVGRFSVPALGKLKLAADRIGENLKTYYGGVLAKIGDVEIMRNAFKTKDALPAGLPRRIMSDAEKKAYYTDVYLKRFSSLPQEAYDKVEMVTNSIVSENTIQILEDGNYIVTIDVTLEDIASQAAIDLNLNPMATNTVGIAGGIATGIIVRKVVKKVMTKAASKMAVKSATKLITPAIVGSVAGPIGTGIGIIAGLGFDVLTNKVDEAMNRAEYKAEIIEGINDERELALADVSEYFVSAEMEF